MFPFLREIPNKPPPPYPVHRPPYPAFPSDERIKEIVFKRVEELFEKSTHDESINIANINDATFVTSPTTANTTITIETSIVLSPSNDEINVFERIIFDCCDEIMREFNTHGEQTAAVYKKPLVFYNPRNRLLCIQEHVLKRVLKLSNRYDTTQTNQQVIRSCLPSQVAQLTYNNRRKRDAVDEILIQELYEEEARWTNFDLEEEEIRNSVTDLKTLLTDESSVQEEASANATISEQ